MTLPIDTTTLTTAANNQQATHILASAANINALSALFDNAAEMYTYVQTFAAPGAIDTANLTDLAVTTAKLAALAVTTAKIALLAVTSAQLADSAVTSAKILDGTIVNADINASAAIDGSKLANLSITSSQIANDTILDADINSAAAIAWTKISKAASSLADLATRSATDLTSGTLNVSRLPTAIPATNIGNGDVSNALLSLINSLTSNAQTQLDAKAPLTHVGQGGTTQHPDATTSQSGFISVADLIAFRALQASTGLSSYSIPVGQVFPFWSRYSQEQDPVTGEMVFYEI